MTSRKQRVVLTFTREHELITIDDAIRLLPYYCNARKHTGALLSNMVRRGMLDRVKPGVFRVATKHQEKHEQPEML